MAGGCFQGIISSLLQQLYCWTCWREQAQRGVVLLRLKGSCCAHPAVRCARLGLSHTPPNHGSDEFCCGLPNIDRMFPLCVQQCESQQLPKSATTPHSTTAAVTRVGVTWPSAVRPPVLSRDVHTINPTLQVLDQAIDTTRCVHFQDRTGWCTPPRLRFKYPPVTTLHQNVHASDFNSTPPIEHRTHALMPRWRLHPLPVLCDSTWQCRIFELGCSTRAHLTCHPTAEGCRGQQQRATTVHPMRHHPRAKCSFLPVATITPELQRPQSYARTMQFDRIEPLLPAELRRAHAGARARP
jgi:hypothetical protein